MQRQDLLEKIPDYLLGLLSDAEAAELETFLASDAEAQQALEAYRVVMESIALSAPYVAPPPTLEAKLERAIAPKRQHPPHHLFFLLGTMAALFSIIVGAWLFLRPQDTSPNTIAEKFEAIGTDPNGVEVPLVPDLSPQTQGALRFRSGSNVAIIQIKNPPPITPDQVYQIWIVDQYGPVSGGIYQLDPDVNYIELELEKPVDEYVRFGMTIEPYGGSPFLSRPSGTRIFNIQLRPSE